MFLRATARDREKLQETKNHSTIIPNQVFISTIVSEVWTFKSHRNSWTNDPRSRMRRGKKKKKKEKVKRKESSLSGCIKVDTCMFQAVPVACPVELMN